MYVLFVIMILLPVLLITYFSAEYFRSVLLQSLTSKAMQTLEQVSYTVDSQASRMITTIASISHDKDVMTNATKFHRSISASDHFKIGQMLDHQLASYFHYTSEVVAVDIFYKREGVYSYKLDLNTSEQEMRNQSWYQKALKEKNKVQFFGIEESEQASRYLSPVLTAAISPLNNADYDVEMLYFTFQASTIQSLLRSSVPSSGPVIVLDRNQKIVAGSSDMDKEQQWLTMDAFQRALTSKSGHYTATVDKKESYIIYQTSDSGWKYIQMIPYEQFNRQLDVVVRRTILVSLIALIIFLAISILVIQRVVKPILELVKQMNIVKRGKLEANIKESGPMEIYVLGATFNEMMDRMKDLLVEVEEKEKAKKHAEINALQSQINPHFLLNTLNTIKIMAIVSKSDNIRMVAESLTKLLSATFNKGGDYTSIADEITLLEYYVNIMKIRYGDHFDVDYQIEPQIMDSRILKLLLQPMIENAIIHGLQGLNYRGHVTVSASRLDESKLCIIIEDNGNGMLPVEVESLLSISELDKERFSGLGLRNVHQRIQLNYGTDYGVTLTSVPDKGTSVKMLLPLLNHLPQLK